MFNVKDKVITPNGVGYVDFVEDDDYIEVRIDSAMFAYTAPFDSVKPFVEDQTQDLDYDAILNAVNEHSKLLEYIGAMQHQKLLAIMSVTSGTVGSWEGMNSFQKLNYIAVGTGITTEQWIDAYRNGTFGDLW